MCCCHQGVRVFPDGGAQWRMQVASKKCPEREIVDVENELMYWETKRETLVTTRLGDNQESTRTNGRSAPISQAAWPCIQARVRKIAS